jgi:hypothetical protein
VFDEDGFSSAGGSEQADGFTGENIEIDPAKDVVFSKLLM